MLINTFTKYKNMKEEEFIKTMIDFREFELNNLQSPEKMDVISLTSGTIFGVEVLYNKEKELYDIGAFLSRVSALSNSRKFNFSKYMSQSSFSYLNKNSKFKTVKVGVNYYVPRVVIIDIAIRINKHSLFEVITKQ